MQNLAFTRVKMHFPCLLPLFKFSKDLLQGLGIIFAGDGQIYGSVRRNKIGPRTEPWGTPEVTGISDDFSSSKATHCERPSKKALIQLRLFRVIPCW